MDNKQIGTVSKGVWLGILLYLCSIVLMLLLAVIGFVYGIVKSFYNTHFIDGLKTLNEKFYKLAFMKDQTGNIVCFEWFNDALIAKDSADKFGSEDETISSVLGKNQITNKLTKTGWFFANILNKIQPNHCINSIDK